MSFDQVSLNQVSFDPVSFDQVSFEHLIFDQVSFDQVSYNQASFGKVPFDQESIQPSVIRLRVHSNICRSTEQCSPLSNTGLKVGLHYGDYHSKLVPFEEQKNIFLQFKKALA